MRKLRLALAQINSIVGDFEGNLRKITERIDEARALGVDIIAFPELALCGYPPEDLLLKPSFIQRNLEYLERVVGASTGIAVVVGFVDAGEDLHNAAAIISDRRLYGVYHKIYLPNYGVFDELRYFRPGSECPVYVIGGVGVGVNICEDIWYEAGPAASQALYGAEVIINISSSPYYRGRGAIRQQMLGTRAMDSSVIVCFANMVGGQDELLFDGQSAIFDEQGRLVARGKQFEEDLVVADIDIESVFRTRLHNPRSRRVAPLWGNNGVQIQKVEVSSCGISLPKPPLEPGIAPEKDVTSELYSALKLGTRDYVVKNRFQKAVVGVSGGVDSALVAAIASDGLGPENVTGVMMPSPYTSPQSIADAKQLADNLGIRLITIPINSLMESYRSSLAEVFKGVQPDVTEENIQARIRGNLLMALSNKFGWLVLNTGNKSEMATGYTTLYGDMAGGFAVLKDVVKTEVYELARYFNLVAGRELIPVSIIEKVPSAELRPGQKDTDSLPPYELLDKVLVAYVEEDKSLEQIVAMGVSEEITKKVIRLVDTSEYKRRQAPPGIKITPRAFGRDRRLPITNWFRG